MEDYLPSDTIYFYENTTVNIGIDSPKDLQGITVMLNGEEYYNVWGNNLSFPIDLYRIDDGEHQLTLVANFSSGTGSLADLLGLEGYVGEITWNIVVISNIEEQFKLNYRINSEGFFEYYWHTPLPNSYISSYILKPYTGSNEEIHIDDPSQKSFVNYRYVAGYFYCEIEFHLQNGRIFYKKISRTLPTPDFTIEEIDLHQFRVICDKPVANGKFRLTIEDQVVADWDTISTFTAPQLFGRTRWVAVDILPLNIDDDNTTHRIHIAKKYTQGISLNLSNSNYAYNTSQNTIYSTRWNKLVAIDGNTLEEIRSVEVVNIQPYVAAAPHNSTVAAITVHDAWIFPNNLFINPQVIGGASVGLDTHAKITTDNRLFIFKKNINTCKVYNIDLGAFEFEFQFTYPPISSENHIAITEDGHYFMASSEDGIEIYEINGVEANLIYSDSREYRKVMAVPSQPQMIVCRVDSDIEVRQLPSFSLIQSIDVSDHGGVIHNVDPVTQNLLYSKNDSIRICNLANINETFFKLRSESSFNRLYNNKLLNRYGIALDLSPYIGD